MTAVLDYPVSQITPRVRTKRKKPALVSNLYLRRHNAESMTIGTAKDRETLKGPELLKFLDLCTFRSSIANVANVVALKKFPDFRTRNKWRIGSVVLIAVGTGEGAMIGVSGSGHAVGHAKFCRQWRTKLGLTRGKVRYFRVMGAK